MPVLAWLVAALLAALDLFAVATGRHRLERVAKPLAVAAVLGAGLASGLLERPWGGLAVLGLLLGLVGDVLLLEEGEGRFLAGLSAFLLGHLAYLAAYARHGLGASGWLVVSAVVLAGCLLASRRVLPAVAADGGVRAAGPVAAYVLVLGVTALAAGATGEPLVALGGALFLLSDTLLALDRFVRPRAHAHVAVMATYLLAQAGIVGGLAVAVR